MTKIFSAMKSIQCLTCLIICWLLTHVAIGAPPPSIDQLLPSAVCTGDSMRVIGQHLTGTTAVRIGTLNILSFVVRTGTARDTVVMLVPAAATSGIVEITTPDGTAASAAALTVNSRPTTPALTAAGPTAFCVGGQVTLIATAGAAGYRWYRDNGLISGATTFFYTATQSGSYTVEAIGAGGCASTRSAGINVIANELPVLDLRSDTTVCTGATVPLTLLATGSAPFTYSWSPSQGLSATNVASPVATATTTTTYTVTVTDNKGCKATASVTVTVRPALSPYLVANTSTDICANETASFTVAPSGAGTYEFRINGAVVQSSTDNVVNIINLSDNDVISARLITPEGCAYSTTNTLTMNVYPLSSIDFTHPVNTGISSTKDTVQLKVNINNVATTANVTFSGPGVAGSIFYPAIAGIGGPYQVIATHVDPSFGCVIKDTIALTVFDGNSAIAGLQTRYCVSTPSAPISIANANGDTLVWFYRVAPVNFSGFTFMLQTTGGYAPYFTTRPSNNVVNTYSVIPAQLTPGTYTFRAEYRRKRTGNTTASFYIREQVVTILPRPVLNISGLANNATLCHNGGNVSLIGVIRNTDGSELEIGSFSGSGIVNLGTNTGNAYFNPRSVAPGNYTIRYEATNSNGCTSADSIRIQVAPASSVNILTDIMAGYCLNAREVLTLTATPAGGVFEGPGVFLNNGVYTFTPSAVNIAESSSSRNIFIDYIYTAPNGCKDTVFRSTTITRPPELNTTNWQFPNSICRNGGLYQLNGITPTNGVFHGRAVYFYSDASYTGYVYDAELAYTSLRPTDNASSKPDTIRYTFSTIGLNSCTSDTFVHVLNVHPNTPLSLTLPDTYCQNGVPFSVQANPSGGVFQLDGVTFSGTINPALLSPGKHTVSYTYTSSFGCQNIIQDSVFIRLPSAVTLPNLSSGFCVNQTIPVPLAATPGGGLFYIDNVLAGSSFVPASLTVGSHELRYEYVNADGCRTIQAQTFQIHPVPLVTFSAMGQYCMSQTTPVVLNAAQNGGVFRGKGVTDNGNGSASFNPNAAAGLLGMTTTSTTQTRDTVFYRFTNPTTGCTDSSFRIFTINPLPQPSFSGLNAAYCVSDQMGASLIGNPVGTSGIFSGPGITANLSGTARFIPAQAGVGTHALRYTYTDPNGCTNFVERNVVVNPLPVLDFTGLNAAYCANVGTDIVLTPNQTGGTFSGLGIRPGTNRFNPALLVSLLPAGTTLPVTQTITYTYTDGNTCTNTVSKQVIINPLPTPSFPRLADYCMDVSNPILLTATPAGGTFTGNGIQNTGSGQATFTPSVAAAQAGMTTNSIATTTHIISYSFTDPNGCTGIFRDTLLIFPLPRVSFAGFNASRTYCVSDNTVSLQGSPTGAGGTFSGPGINNTAPGQANFVPSLAGVGTHVITFTHIDSRGCDNEVQQTVVINPLPVLDFTGLNAAYCANVGTDIVLTPNQTGGTFSGLGIRPGTNLFNPALLVSLLPAGTTLPVTQTITYTYTDGNTCTNTVSKQVTINPLPVPTFQRLSDYCMDVSTPIMLTATITGGTFTGNGIQNIGSGQATFTPSLAATQAGMTTNSIATTTQIISYSVTDPNGCTGIFRDTLLIFPLPRVSFTGFNTIRAYCLLDNTVALQGSPTGVGGTFSGPGINNTAPGQANFVPSLAGVGTHVITFTYIDSRGCDNEVQQTVIVHPMPVANFNFAGQCINSPTVFTDLSSVGSGSTIVRWQWQFTSQLSDTSALPSPSFTFTEPGIYPVRLRVWTDKGCDHQLVRNIKIGALPIAKFGFFQVCANAPTSFTDSSSVILGTIERWQWNFGTGQPGDTSALRNPQFQFPNPGTYQISLTVTTDTRCTATFLRSVSILPSVNTFPYRQTFDADNGNWASGGNNSSWGWQQAQGFWTTGQNANGTYNNREQSFLDGPCFDFTNIERPMISLRYRQRLEPGRDGAALFSSIDGGATWQLVGTLNDPVNWYNTAAVTGNPGRQPINQWSWSSSDTAWRVARNLLDHLRGQARVRFRIAFGSDESTSGTFGYPLTGFAVDSIFVGDRTRNVLLENFTTTANQNDRTPNLLLYDLLNQSFARDVVGLQYHTAPQNPSLQDPLNLLNPFDPSARALYYGFTSTPRAAINGNRSGSYLQDWTRKDIEREILRDQPFDLQITPLPQLNDSLRFRVSARANQAVTRDELVLQIAVIEREVRATDVITGGNVTNGQPRFEWVHKRFLPNAAGISYRNRPWTVGTQRDTTLSVGLIRDQSTPPTLRYAIYQPNQVAIVAFVQNNQTKEVLQAAYWKPATTPSLITGLGDELLPADLQELSLFPNPAQITVNLLFGKALENEYRWTFANLLGQTLQSGQLQVGDTGTQIPVEQLPSGLYLMTLYSKEGKPLVVRKVMVD